MHGEDMVVVLSNSVHVFDDDLSAGNLAAEKSIEEGFDCCFV